MGRRYHYTINECADSTCMANRNGFCHKGGMKKWEGCNSIQRTRDFYPRKRKPRPTKGEGKGGGGGK
jgi:hypothetical protein